MFETQTCLIIVLSFMGNLWLNEAYTQVAINGNTPENNGPRIFKALNTDLIFPKIFNSSENVISTTEGLSINNSSTTTITAPWPYNHRTETTAAASEAIPIYVTPASSPVVVPNFIQSEAQYQSSEKIPNLQTVEQFESQDLTIPEPQLEESAATGRAVDYRTGYPFGQLLNPLMKPTLNYVKRKPQTNYGRQQPVYYKQQQQQPSRAELQKLRGQAQFSDRFAPSEGVAAAQFLKNGHGHDHSHHHDNKVSAPSNFVQSYAPPKNVYAFPPLNANYPSPSNDPKAAQPSDTVTSYLPPASGPLINSEGLAGYQYKPPAATSAGYQYPGPVSPTPDDNKGGYQYPTPDDNKDAPKDAGGDSNGDDGAGDNDDTIGVLPASAMDDGKGADDMKAADDAQAADDHDHHHHHDDHDYDPNKEYATPPPGWLEAHPESAAAKPADHDDHHDHDHDHDHHGITDYSDVIQYSHGYPSFPDFPEHIYDDHYPHHHHHHVEPPPPPPPEPTTPEPLPPPEPAPEPRVKKYSYFYIGRKLWYIPLYFTVWFSFYVLWLIVKSIARHKVNLPNHYVNRRSLPDYSNKKRDEYINDLTVSVLEHIDSFKQKYLS